MLFLAKLVGILILIWFYMSAKKLDEPAIKWAVIGLIGYWISWWLADKLILEPIGDSFTTSKTILFILTQIPVVIGVVVAFFVRIKLLTDAEKNKNLTE